ncbi:MAG TPA: hypothetical protein VEV15_10200 [Flavisolibacter sp.]|nr:hypothetical protein [Flavisolibacter sp.]
MLASSLSLNAQTNAKGIYVLNAASKTPVQDEIESAPVTEIHFTPGTPFFARLSLAWFF